MLTLFRVQKKRHMIVYQSHCGAGEQASARAVLVHAPESLTRRRARDVTQPAFLSLSPLLLAQLLHRSADMANVADTKLYDILGVSPSATENELKKVETVLSAPRIVS